MGRRKLNQVKRFVDPEVVDHVLKEVRRELIKDPLLVLDLNDKLNDKRGRELLTALMDLQPARKPSPIYN